MKKLFTLILLSIGLVSYADPSVVSIDQYEIKIVAKVPRIYDNTQSLGYRKYQNQRITGDFYVYYYDDGSKQFICTNMVNLTHKINGSNVTYTCTIDNYGEYVYPRWNAIGNNKTGKFNVSSVAFYMDMEPSYNVGEDEPDNSLLLTFSGYGTMATKKIYWFGYNKNYITYQVNRITSGYATGTMGCGCRAYGHKSPTRIIDECGPSDSVDDVASVYARFQLKFIKRIDCN